MPKPFMIGVEIEEVAFGAVMRRIDALDGVIKIHLNLNKEKPPRAKSNGHSRPHGSYEISGQEEMALILHGKPPMTTGQLRDAFKARGRSGASIASVLHAMQKTGDIKKVDDGYTLTTRARDRLRHRAAKAAKKK